MSHLNQKMPLVSFIVPVYNAEKFLGYCLNSIMQQTYTNIEAILVNDGSTDKSLEICQRYAHLDKRFKVFDIPNGGVSRARNFGIQQASGYYFTLLDSDDVVPAEMVEWMVEAEQQANTGLVVGNVQFVNFETREVLPTKLTGRFKDSKAHYAAEEFRRHKMSLIWHTSLFEGVYSKLYRRDLWVQNNVQYPSHLSLGEDFVANLHYYSVCNGVAFLDKTVYYYNNIQNSTSLSHKFRPDLFQNKMLLVDALLEHLGDINTLDEEEKACMYNYIASSGLSCVENIHYAQNVDAAEKLNILNAIAKDPRFLEALKKAPYMHPQWTAYVPLLQQGKTQKILKLPRARTASAAGAAVNGPQSGIVNRVMRKSLRVGARLLGNNGISRKILKVEQSLANVGIKNTIVHFLPSVRNRRILMMQVQTSLDQMQAKLESHLQLSDDPSASSIDFNPVVQEVKDYVYVSEQRQMFHFYRLWANELRQRKKAILLGTAEHQNIGDAAIAMAMQTLLRRQFPEYYQVECSTYETSEHYDFIRSIVNEDDIIFIAGGGNLGSLYAAEEEMHRRIIREFPFNKIVVFPQTIHFTDDEHGRAELALSQKDYNAHDDLTIFARGKASYAFAQQHFSHAQSYLMPDVVFSLKRDYHQERSGVLLCLREDQEGVMTGDLRREIQSYIQSLGIPTDHSTNIAPEDIIREKRSQVVHEELRRFAGKELVITDRLHGLIFSVVTGTPVIVLKSAGHKIEDFYDSFLKESPAVRYLSAPTIEQIQDAVEYFRASSGLEHVYPQEPLTHIREYILPKD